MTRTMLAVLTLTLAAANQLPAQDAPQDGDPNGRAVARLSFLNGDVSVRRGDTGEMMAAALNAPLMGEDQVLTSEHAKAEVQFDYGTFARLAGNGELRLADIENRKYLLRLAHGTMTFRILRNIDSDTEISTPSIAVRPLKKGVYRISVLDDGSTEVTVRNGEAEIFTPRGTQRLKSGRTMMARGNANDPEFQYVNAIMVDDWDRWNESRDRQLERSKSYDYVSQDIYGAEDLDYNGRWENTPDYGNVWVPNTSPDWAPYQNGRWTWVDYYGWNWVSYDPWGWAPYHYGRWINRPVIGWCWWPGRIQTRHYWSPGLVAFFGWGRGGVSVGFGNVGWVPLAPFETYYPWYGRGYYGGYRNRTINNITIVNNTNITNIYRNARVNNGITAVHAGDFGRGSVNAVRFDRNEIQSASMVRGQLPLVPDSRSTRLSDRESRIADNRAATRADDRFFSTRQAARVDRVPFENQRASLQETSRRTFGDNGSGRGGEVAAGAGRGSDTFNGRVSGMDRGSDRSVGRGGSNNGESNTGWRRVGDPNASNSSGRGGNVDNTNSSRGAGNDTGGWRRMGDTTQSGRGGSVDNSNSARGNGSVDNTNSSRGAGNDNGGWRRMGDTTQSGRGGSVDSSNSSRGNGNDNGGWRRFGDSSSSNPGTDRSVDRGTDRGADRSAGRGGSIDNSNSSRGGDSGSWRRFGDSTSSNPNNGNSGSRGADANSAWRQMNDPAANRGNDNRSPDRGSFGNRGQSSIDRGSSDRGPTDRGSFNRAPSMDSAPRMAAPPVVRERSNSDNGNRGGSFGNFGGGRGGGEVHQSAPRMEQRSAPPAPAPSGGGGGNHGGGNGGGGSRGGDNGGGRGQGHGGKNR